MAGSNIQKLKLLRLMKIFQEYTDAEHGLTMPELIEELSEQGISAERKSLYADIDALCEFGFPIKRLRTQPVQYALIRRNFNFAQLTLLIDAIQSSRFLSDKSSNELVKAIKSLASRSERLALNKQIHVHGRPRIQTQSDFVAVDRLQEAMAHHQKVSFRYVRYDANKKKVARKDGARHVVTPVSIVYADDNYYLVAYSQADQSVRNYRIDRMEQILKLEEPAEKNQAISSYNPDEAGNYVFGMYSGERVALTLLVQEDVMNVVVDRFGRDVVSVATKDGRAAHVTAHVVESPVLYGWIAMLGSKVAIESPNSVKEHYLAYLRDILKRYN